MMDWWEEANYKKNRGFYVDYSNSLETPMQILSEEYKQAHRIVIEFQNQMLEVINYFKGKTKEEKKEISRIHNEYVHQILSPIIEGRRKEMRGRNTALPIDMEQLTLRIRGKIQKGKK